MHIIPNYSVAHSLLMMTYAYLLTVLLIAFPLYECDDTILLDYVNTRNDEKYHFGYRIDDGQTRMETGQLIEKGDNAVFVVQGQYSFVADKKLYNVKYFADENGYRPIISVSPQPEPTPIVTVPYISPRLLSSLAGGGLG